MLPVTMAWWFLPFVAPIAVWVAWSDMKFMRIPNRAVLALAAVYLLVGPVALPVTLWLWGWALLAIVLAIGFVASALHLVGAGDAKFAAAMAPFFVRSDLSVVLVLFSACLVAAFVTHRSLKQIPAFRRATPDWESWTRKEFPMGLALAATLIFYLVAVILLH
ncbi:MAG: prepilin peptidase [Pseudorhodobacter sp.]|nr:prepilin peptidase [Pseudorhodobacter sp.]